MTTMRGLAMLALIALATLPAGGAARAQGLFSAVAEVNGQAINRYQVDQRARFLGLLRAPNAGFDGARDALIDETLQVQAARADGIEITPEELDTAMVEFAGRVDLTPDAFIEVLEANGIAPETYRDFARNGLYWRRLVQARFGPRARPSDTEVERTLAQGSATSGTRVLLSEIAMPLTPQTRDEVLLLARRLSQEIAGPDEFQQAARRFSRAPSAARGGRLDWLPVAQLAPPVAAQVLGLSPGQVSAPVDLGSFVGVYLLRDLDDGVAVRSQTRQIDYAEYRIPGGPDALAEAGRVRARIDTCDDLYGIARGAPDRLIRETHAVDQLPPDLRQALAGLDQDEATTLTAADGALRFVMLCERVTEAPEGAFEQVGQRLLNQRLTSYAQGYLEELRADAVIERF